MVNLIDPTATAELLGVPEKTLAQGRYQHKGPAFIKVGRHVRYRTEDIADFIAVQTVQPRRSA
ncbi:hypothetical protein BH10ACT2_BH10ACT2_08430 [soil metagenome]